MASKQTKTYFWVAKFTSEEIKNGKTDSKVFTFKFPPEFIASRNSKWIVIEECKAIKLCQFVPTQEGSCIYFNMECQFLS